MSSPQPEPEARRHERVRRQHSNELAQDYVEAIQELSRDGGTARVTDLQRIFGVSHVSVIRALRRFEERGLLARPRGAGIRLTRDGARMAEESASRHILVVRFLRLLGVSGPQAEADAEGIEHHLSRETLDALKSFVARGELP